MSDEYVEQPDGRMVAGPTLPRFHPPVRRGPPAYVFVLPLLAFFVGVGLYVFVLGGEEAGPARAPQPQPSPPAFSEGITQAQLDRLGESIGARYQTGDTEVAQALLDNFMDAHPECVSAVMAGGEGKMREVLRRSEQVAAQLRGTAPHPAVYTTVITVKNDGVVKAAVLGVSCEGGGG